MNSLIIHQQLEDLTSFVTGENGAQRNQQLMKLYETVLPICNDCDFKEEPYVIRNPMKQTFHIYHVHVFQRVKGVLM